MHLKPESSMSDHQQKSPLGRAKLPTLHSFFTAETPCVMPHLCEEQKNAKIPTQKKKAIKF